MKVCKKKLRDSFIHTQESLNFFLHTFIHCLEFSVMDINLIVKYSAVGFTVVMAIAISFGG